MKIETGKYAVRVDYRVPGKVYNVASEGVAPFSNEKQSTYPFDSKDIAVGESFDTEGLDVVRVVEYTPTHTSDDTQYLA